MSPPLNPWPKIEVTRAASFPHHVLKVTIDGNEIRGVREIDTHQGFDDVPEVTLVLVGVPEYLEPEPASEAVPK